MNGVGERERRHVRLALMGPKSERERERVTRRGVQSLAMLYFLPSLLYPKLIHF